MRRDTKKTEGAGEIGDDRCVEALRSQKKKKQEVRQKGIFNIQTEGGPMRDQYITGNREEEGEQTEAEDTMMSEGNQQRRKRKIRR